MADIRSIQGGVTAPSGFQAAGLHCGIKKRGMLDLALIVSERNSSATCRSWRSLNCRRSAGVWMVSSKGVVEVMIATLLSLAMAVGGDKTS